ncbi:hypothetical protein ONS95_013539 [Cadophora gregata]|uniref:uncharacterized protein n=1 Tax=Cadophora gregata TaxID=51156 RepID=UPI0026DDB1CD|nr:uncharacterized protein ONS95_013539 [Cadophora gregata]KAK0099565.1 hypothetical protein ONS96_008066 [Cadophora gregata f. sp. sojae]KAK0116525.1 hypothetical protein ONS95_013539 [Cadophora gregata]
MKQNIQVARLSDQQPHLKLAVIELDYVAEVIGSPPRSTSARAHIFRYWDSIFSVAQDKGNTKKIYEDLEDTVFRLLTLDRERIDRQGLWTICKARDGSSKNARKAYTLWTKQYSGDISEISEEFLQKLMTDELVDLFYVTSSTVTAGMKAFVTERGWIGMGPERMMPGDVVIIVAGADVPLILRVDDRETRRLVGEAYVQGIMDGEAVEMGLPVVDVDIY